MLDCKKHLTRRASVQDKGIQPHRLNISELLDDLDTEIPFIRNAELENRRFLKVS